MKLLLLAIASTLSVGVWANALYDSNSFGVMPHKDIMRINIDNCNIEANATGDEAAAKECVDNQKIAFEKLLIVYNDHAITAPSWSLCLSEAKTRHSYNYVVMYACMKVVKDICKEKIDGQWENPSLCIRSMQSGAWLKNPKIYQPYKKQ